MSSIAILIMLFVKDDLLNKIIDKLKEVEGIDNVHLVFLQDNILGSKFFNFNRFINNFTNCQHIIKNRINEFKSAEYICNDYNKGVYRTHYEGLEYCLSKHKYVIYIEDDVIVTKNFLNFFNYFFNNNLLGLGENKIQFIAGESIFFESRKKEYEFTEEKISLLLDYIEKKKLNTYYYIQNTWCPSSCFCISNEIWDVIKHIKNQTHSDTLLSKFIRDNNLKTVMPIVPLCEDIGMLHDSGYSVQIHTKNNVSEIKNGYIFEELKSQYSYELYKDNTSIIYGEIRNIMYK
jgi:hypothetical protein